MIFWDNFGLGENHVKTTHMLGKGGHQMMCNIQIDFQFGGTWVDKNKRKENR